VLEKIPNVTLTVPATFEKPTSLKIIEYRAKGRRRKRNKVVYILGAVNNVESVSTRAPKFDGLPPCTPLSRL